MFKDFVSYIHKFNLYIFNKQIYIFQQQFSYWSGVRGPVYHIIIYFYYLSQFIQVSPINSYQVSTKSSPIQQCYFNKFSHNAGPLCGQTVSQLKIKRVNALACLCSDLCKPCRQKRRHACADMEQHMAGSDWHRQIDWRTGRQTWRDKTRREARGMEGKRWRGAVYMSRDRQSILWPETATKTTPTRTPTMLRAEAASLNSFKAATKIFWHGPREANSSWAEPRQTTSRSVCSISRLWLWLPSL